LKRDWNPAGKNITDSDSGGIKVKRRQKYLQVDKSFAIGKTHIALRSNSNKKLDRYKNF